MDVVRHLQLDARVPTGPIEYEDNLLLWAGAGLTGKLRQFDLEHRNADRRREMEEGASGCRMHKPDEVAPGKTVLDDGGGTLANRRLSSPDPPQEGL